MIQKIEIDFPVQVNVSVEADILLNKALQIICKEYEEKKSGQGDVGVWLWMQTDIHTNDRRGRKISRDGI